MKNLALSPVKFTANSQVQTLQNNTNKKEENNNNTSNQSKVLIGLGALASLAIGGIIFHRAQQAKSVIKKANEIAHKINLLPAQKSANTGTTVQETIQNVLGKNSYIKPHTYDTSLEFHTMHIYRNQGGYKDGVFTKNGTIDNKTYSLYPESERNIIYDAAFSGNNKKTNNKVVKLSVTDPTNINGDTFINFTLISPNNQYTPAQLDLLKLVNNPDKIDISVLDKIFKFKPGNDANGKRIIENCGKYENLDYDLVLSVIQSMASKC